MYDWDSCLFAQFAHRIGIDGLPLSVVRNFLAVQEENGFIPRTVSPGRIWDQGDLCKPFLCQTLVEYMERTQWQELSEVRALLPGLRDYLEYFRTHRQHESGLFFWRNVLESGVDDNYALMAPREAKKDEDQACIRYPDGRLLAVDLNSYLVAEFRAFARLCCACDEIEPSREYAMLAHTLACKIEARLWDKQLTMYVNVDPDDNTPVSMRSWVGLLPALLDITTRSRASQVLLANALDERHFLRKFGIASMAASEPLSNQAPRGLYGNAIVCNWNGPVWVLPNVLTVRALVRLGLIREAKDVARRVVAAMVRDVKRNGVLHENYNADTGEALWAPQFMSWNIMALELIELLEKPARKRGTKSMSR
jgi:putative isomerase